MKILKNAAVILPAALVLLLLTSPSFGDVAEPTLPHALTSTDYSLCLTGATLLSVLLMALMQRKRPQPVDAAVYACMAAPLAIVCARVGYCAARYSLFMRADRWTMIFRATQGGYLLYGAVAGAALAAWVYSIMTKRSIMDVLDAVAVPGLLLIGLGRFAEYFTTVGRGDYVDDGLLSHFPFALSDKWGYAQLAPFIWEGVAALVLMAAVWLVCKGGEGSFVTALVLYACCQAVLESVPNGVCMIGFVRINQVLSGVAVLAVTAWRAFRKLSKGMAWLRTLLCVLMIAGIGIMEWGLDKLNASDMLLYGVMVACSAVMAVNCLSIPAVRD